MGALVRCFARDDNFLNHRLYARLKSCPDTKPSHREFLNLFNRK